MKKFKVEKPFAYGMMSFGKGRTYEHNLPNEIFQDMLMRGFITHIVAPSTVEEKPKAKAKPKKKVEE